MICDHRLVPAALMLVLSACGGGGGLPAAASPSGAIGPEGGTITSADGAARLVVPRGALGSATSLTLRSAVAPLDARAIPGAAYELAPPGTTFSSPASLTIRYDPARRPSGTREEELRAYLSVGDRWMALAQSSVNPATGQVEGSVAGAGLYAPYWAGPGEPCSAAEDRQFDFWQGHWSFASPNAAAGTDDVAVDATGCFLEEDFRDTQGGRGRSVTLRSRLDGRWHQTYLDSSGRRTVLIGLLDGGRMLLAETATQRYVWEPRGPDAVHFFGERSADGGATFALFFDSTYTRR